MVSKHKELSYFSLRLEELFRTSFPELAGDKTSIKHRSQLAENAYGEAFIAGNTVDQCTKIAEYILFEG